MTVPAPFPLPEPDDPDGGPPEPEWYGLTAQPMGDGDGRRVNCRRPFGKDPFGPGEDYCGGSMRRRPGLDDDDDDPPDLLRRFVEPEGR